MLHRVPLVQLISIYLNYFHKKSMYKPGQVIAVVYVVISEKECNHKTMKQFTVLIHMLLISIGIIR